ncbi:hypothetical protein C0992_003923 [Termitomyces sp. T32_za158]|nr:hypothetical protein C0992_003923 [Termitomyces sp. T32_za158]
MTGSPHVPRETTAVSPQPTSVEDEIEIASWRDSRECEELVKEITVDRISPWSQVLKGYKLDKLGLHQCRDVDSDTVPTARLFASFSLPEEQEKAIKDKTIWLIILERIESSSEFTPCLSSRVPAAIAAEYGIIGHSSEPSTEATSQSQSLDTTILTKHVATMFCGNEVLKEWITETTLHWLNLPLLWDCEFGNNHRRHRPDIREFFLAIDVILTHANLELEKIVPRESWFPTLLALLIHRVYAKDTSKTSMTSEPAAPLGEKARKTPIFDSWNKERWDLLEPILSELRHSYKKRLREDQIETFRRFTRRLIPGPKH